ncbi:hypothetical protein F7725_000668, partial [Dissostichus mawsoni]
VPVNSKEQSQGSDSLLSSRQIVHGPEPLSRGHTVIVNAVQSVLSLCSHLTITGLLELVPDALQLLHGLHVGCTDPLEDALLLVQTLLQCVGLALELFLRQCILVVFLDSLLPHHDFLLVLLQLVLFVVYLDTQTGLLGLKLKTKAKWCCVSVRFDNMGETARLYLHVEGEVAGFGLFQITLGVLESHLQTVGLRLHLTQLRLLPLGLHLLVDCLLIPAPGLGLQVAGSSRDDSRLLEQSSIEGYRLDTEREERARVESFDALHDLRLALLATVLLPVDSGVSQLLHHLQQKPIIMGLDMDFSQVAARLLASSFRRWVRSWPWLCASSSIRSSNSCLVESTACISLSSSSMSPLRFLYIFWAFCKDLRAASSFLILCEVFSFALMYCGLFWFNSESFSLWAELPYRCSMDQILQSLHSQVAGLLCQHEADGIHKAHRN